MAKLKREKSKGKLDITIDNLEAANKFIEPIIDKLKSSIAKIATELVFNALDGSWIDIDDEKGNCTICLDFMDKKGNPITYQFNLMDLLHDSKENKEFDEVDAIKVLRNLADQLEKKRTAVKGS